MHYDTSVMLTRRAVNTPLTDDDLARRVPAIFAPRAHDSRSDRYAFIPSLRIIQALREAEYLPMDVSAANVRSSDKRGFQKHLVRLRHKSNLVGNRGGAPELIFLNSHDGSSSYRMYAGWIEFLCTNGMVAGKVCGEARIKHTGDAKAILEEIQHGARNMMQSLQLITSERETWRQIAVTADEQRAYAKAALQLRYASQDADGKPKDIPLEPDQILLPRRHAEQGEVVTLPGKRPVLMPHGNIWATMNVVQENLIRGGIVGAVKDAKGNRKYRKQRPVQGIDQNTALNQALWTLTSEFAKLKA